MNSRPPVIPTGNISTSASINDSFGLGASTSTSSHPLVFDARKENAFFRPARQQNGNGSLFGSGSGGGSNGGGLKSASASVCPERPSMA